MNVHAITIESPGRAGALAPAWPWLVLAAGALAAFHWDALQSLAVAWRRPEYSHGPVVPLVAAYVMLRSLHRRQPAPDAGSAMPGLALVTFALLLGLLGNVSRIADVSAYALVLSIGGFILIVAGSRAGLRFWPAWGLLLFMLPLPQFLYLHLSTWLQSLSSRLGVALIDALGVTVLLDGNIIDLGTYQLQVAEACSGLNYLFPMLCLGWLIATLYNGPNWHRIVIFLSTVPVAILMNALRITVTGVLVDRFGLAQAEGFLHAFEGWVIFMGSTAILCGVAWLLRQMTGNTGRPAGTLDLRVHGLLAPLSKLPQLRANAALVSATLLILVAAVLWHTRHQAQPAMIGRDSLAMFPLQIDGWRGQAVNLDAPTQRVLGADDHLNARFLLGTQRVDLLLTFYNSQTDGSGGIHSPEICLPAGGWEVSQWSKRTIAKPDEDQRRLTVNQAVIRKGSQRQLVYYWFEQRGAQASSEYAAKFMLLRDAVTNGRTDGGLVRLITPIGPAEDVASAEARLDRFTHRIMPMLPQYFPAL